VNFQSRFDETFSIEVCPEFFNHNPVGNAKSRFDEKFSIEVCPEFLNRDPEIVD